MNSSPESANPASTLGPYGPARKVATVSSAKITSMYMVKCEVDVSEQFRGLPEVDLYECARTGMKFWRPEEIAGDERFYQDLSAAWRDYYRKSRWEYGLLRRYLGPTTCLLEIGCGRGHFLKSTEGKVALAKGLEFNNEAIREKVTTWDVESGDIEGFARRGERFDVVCSFQVLEHVTNPATFIEACLACTSPGGVIALSVPNNHHVPHATRTDPFDLPPHHMNHFTPEVMRKVAGAHGLRIEKIVTQRREFHPEPVTAGTGKRLSFKVARKLSGAVFGWIYQGSHEPGHTMLAILRKD